MATAQSCGAVGHTWAPTQPVARYAGRPSPWTVRVASWGMALHCAATLFLVPVGTAPREAAGSGAVAADPVPPGADVVAELAAVADLHRGERVVVPVSDEQLDAVLDHLGRAPRGAREWGPVQLEIGDEGWALSSGSG